MLHHLHFRQNTANLFSQNSQRILIGCEAETVDRLNLVDFRRQPEHRLRVLEPHKNRDVIRRAGLDGVVRDRKLPHADVHRVILLFFLHERDLGTDVDRAFFDDEAHRFFALPRRNVSFRQADQQNVLPVNGVFAAQRADEMVE